MLFRMVPVQGSAGCRCPLKEVENDSVGLIRSNNGGSVFSFWPLGSHLKKKSYI